MNSNRKPSRFLIACLGLLLCYSFPSSSFGQLSQNSSMEIKRDTTIVESEGKFPVITNLFWDNWFLGAGAGAQVYFADHNRQMKFGDRLTPHFGVYFGKWFSPGIGVRAGIAGFKLVGATQNQSYSTGEVYDASQNLEKQELKYFNIHTDVLFNLTNIFSGYQKDRFYTISPYAGLGWIQITDEPKDDDVTAGVGVFNTFRLGEAVDLTLDVRGTAVKDRLDGEEGGRKGEGILSAAIGLVYKFEKRHWDKPTTTTISYDESLLNTLRDRVNALEQDNDALRKQLADAKSSTITDVKVKDRILAAPILVTFPINKATVSNEARVNLGFFADVIKEGNPDVVYKLTGYADKGTGTPAINNRLSKARAEAIYDVLVNEFGVSPSQLEVSHEGGVENMFYDDPRLSRAVITIAK